MSHMPWREAPLLCNPGKKRNKPHTNSGVAQHSHTSVSDDPNTHECGRKQNRHDLVMSCFTGIISLTWRREMDTFHLCRAKFKLVKVPERGDSYWHKRSEN